MTCTPKLKKGKYYSINEISCTASGLSLTDILKLLLGQKTNTILRFEEEDGNTCLYSGLSTGNPKCCKISSSTSESDLASNPLIIIIIIIAVVVIIIIIVFVVILISKKKKSTQKNLPKAASTKTSTDTKV